MFCYVAKLNYPTVSTSTAEDELITQNSLAAILIIVSFHVKSFQLHICENLLHFMVWTVTWTKQTCLLFRFHLIGISFLTILQTKQSID